MTAEKKLELTDESFVRVWQTSDSINEVAENFGIPANVICSRANYFRKRGVKLKYFQKRGRNRRRDEWTLLAELADSFNQQAAVEKRKA